MNPVKDLTKEAPRSPRIRLGGYALLARMIDKGRANLAGRIGDYHYACPLDQMLLEFKKVDGDEALEVLKSGADDEAVVRWLDQQGDPKTPQQVSDWSDTVERAMPYEDPEKRDWFIGECQPLGLDPAQTTLFDYLDADDRASF